MLDRLTRIGLAMHKYHEIHGHFPAPAVVRDGGSPLLSWRVAILPYLGYRSLYERFHLGEPWDSAHDRDLLAEMPPEFACPRAPRREWPDALPGCRGADDRLVQHQHPI